MNPDQRRTTEALVEQRDDRPSSGGQGGVLLRAKSDGGVVGAVGISGASADEDEYCALAAVWSCNADDIATTCTTEPLDHSVRTKATNAIADSLFCTVSLSCSPL